MNRKIMENEPKFSGEVTDNDISKAHNWYRENCDYADAKRWFIEYAVHVKVPRDKVEKLSGVKDHYFTGIGWTARMALRGAILSARSVGWLLEKIDSLTQKVEIEATDKPRTTVQDHINEQVHTLIGDLDEMIDKNEKVEVYQWLVDNNVKGPHARKIFDNYQALKRELQTALAGNDPEVNEFYAPVAKSRIKQILEMVTAIIDNSYLIAQNSKIARKPRAKKAKSAEKLVSKVKYLERDDKLKLQSVPVANVIGCAQLWVFNNKTRKLGVYNADAGGSLSMKGTTVLGFDTKSSLQKKLRKPEKVLPEVVTGGRVALRKVLDNVKAKTAPLSGRINSDTLLLRVIR